MSLSVARTLPNGVAAISSGMVKAIDTRVWRYVCNEIKGRNYPVKCDCFNMTIYICTVGQAYTITIIIAQ